ncbi:hypothetical protein Hte_006924 [Hypoxylon texense]
MHRRIAIKCIGRMRPCFSGPQAARLGYSGLATQCIRQWPPIANAQSFSHFTVPKRQFASQPWHENDEQTLQPLDTEAQHQEQPPRKQATYKSWILFNLVGVAAAFMTAVVLKSAPGFGGGGSDDKKIINKTSFSPFTIVSKEQVSPTAFVLSVRAAAAAEGSGSTAQAQPFREAWDHGLWSVEVKQPQLQIARHYTPLPPPPPLLSSSSSSPSSSSDPNRGDGVPLLRFLIREVDGGEMSAYLGKLRVGDAAWLRGPRLGFDVARRLGGAGRRVVFVAGGTGIAPALQVARRVLDGGPGGGGGGGGGGGNNERGPTVSILWANRRAADALGRQQRHAVSARGGNGWWWWFSNLWRREDKVPLHKIGEHQRAQAAEVEDSSFAQQIRDLERRHPDRFRISYYVDEEGSFIRAQDLRAALVDGGMYTSSSSSSSSTPGGQPLPLSKTCPWHSATALSKLPDDDDFGRRDAECRCGGPNSAQVEGAPSSTATTVGANLICVSGPDGFIEAYAGPKRWYAGTEMQGPVRGVLGRMLATDSSDRAEVEGNWLVLKL